MLAWWLLIKHLFHWQPLWFVLSGVALGVLLNNPSVIGQVSFQLSFLSVAGILAILPFLPTGSFENALPLKTLKRAFSTFIVSCWLLIFTFPIVHSLTGYQSLASPLNNFIHIFFVSTIFLPALFFVLGLNLLGFYTGIEPGEVYIYSLVNFLARIWEKILIWNDSLSSHLLMQIPFEWNAVTLSLFWGFLIAIPICLHQYRNEVQE